jgi:hypothetical protein
LREAWAKSLRQQRWALPAAASTSAVKPPVVVNEGNDAGLYRCTAAHIDAVMAASDLILLVTPSGRTACNSLGA